MCTVSNNNSPSSRITNLVTRPMQRYQNWKLLPHQTWHACWSLFVDEKGDKTLMRYPSLTSFLKSQGPILTTSCVQGSGGELIHACFGCVIDSIVMKTMFSRFIELWRRWRLLQLLHFDKRTRGRKTTLLVVDYSGHYSSESWTRRWVGELALCYIFCLFVDWVDKLLQPSNFATIAWLGQVVFLRLAVRWI